MRQRSRLARPDTLAHHFPLAHRIKEHEGDEPAGKGRSSEKEIEKTRVREVVVVLVGEMVSERETRLNDPSPPNLILLSLTH